MFWEVANDPENTTVELLRSSLTRRKEELYNAATKKGRGARAVSVVALGSKQAREKAIREPSKMPEKPKAAAVAKVGVEKRRETNAVFSADFIEKRAEEDLSSLQNKFAKTEGCRQLDEDEISLVRELLFNAGNRPTVRTEQELEIAMRDASAGSFLVYQNKFRKENESSAGPVVVADDADSPMVIAPEDVATNEKRKKRTAMFLGVGREEFKRIVDVGCPGAYDKLTDADHAYILGQMASCEELMRVDSTAHDDMLEGMRECAFKVAVEYVFSCTDEFFIFRAEPSNNRKKGGKSSAMINWSYYDCAVRLAHAVFVYKTTQNGKAVPQNIKAIAMQRMKACAVRPPKGHYSMKINMRGLAQLLFLAVEDAVREYKFEGKLTKPDKKVDDTDDESGSDHAEKDQKKRKVSPPTVSGGPDGEDTESDVSGSEEDESESGSESDNIADAPPSKYPRN